MTDIHLTATPLLDFNSAPLRGLIADRGWADLPPAARIGAAYDFVRNEIRFGYNAEDALPASRVLADGYGQCNTKAILLMALLRGLGIRCRFHGFTIDKGLQRGVVPELIYPLVPRDILHSWVEVWHDGGWLDLEGFILDAPVLAALQARFPGRQTLCAYGAGTDCLQAPQVGWTGQSTYIQRTGINRDLGVFDAPDEFYARHRQLSGLRGLLYRGFVRHWMNRRVARIRAGEVPVIPGGSTRLEPGHAPVTLDTEA
ncbi:transglutaminase-like domain-containing protein [Pseudooceanicola onchidii]|uniref:transglutaminase-like domain-containing protein n=1 Tax=Pseudooceanicola onchidii TaxID=2562279 RepID=UPI0010AA43A4|nr:transglutaminase family protein [Pseudooceanicola onchidii]